MILAPGAGIGGRMRESEHPTSNIQHPTSNGGGGGKAGQSHSRRRQTEECRRQKYWSKPPQCDSKATAGQAFRQRVERAFSNSTVAARPSEGLMTSTTCSR